MSPQNLVHHPTAGSFNPIHNMPFLSICPWAPLRPLFPNVYVTSVQHVGGIYTTLPIGIQLNPIIPMAEMTPQPNCFNIPMTNPNENNPTGTGVCAVRPNTTISVQHTETGQMGDEQASATAYDGKSDTMLRRENDHQDNVTESKDSYLVKNKDANTSPKIVSLQCQNSLLTSSSKETFWMIPRHLDPIRSDLSRSTRTLRHDSLQLYHLLLRYVPSYHQLQKLGYPVASLGDPNFIFIQKNDYHKRKDSFGEVVTNLIETICTRCGNPFFVKYGKYLVKERCTYHWGKVLPTRDFKAILSCCKDTPSSKGCTTAEMHVWSGLTSGINGPLIGFEKPSYSNTLCKVFGLDCEMCYTEAGLELARVTLVNLGGEKVYDCLVLPEHAIIDYNTRFSGISDLDYTKFEAKDFRSVQLEVLRLIKKDSILVGHSMENDLRALKIVHGLVIDTAYLYPHQYDFPRRRSLNDLAEEVLGIKIHQDTVGHDSAEDASICIKLVLQKLKQDHNVVIFNDRNFLTP